MPETDSFIVSYWHELGLCSNGGYGFIPLSFAEIKAYSDSVNQLEPFEVSAIARMSKAYVSEQSAATKDLGRQSPLLDSKEFYAKQKEYQRAKVSQKLRKWIDSTKE